MTSPRPRPGRDAALLEELLREVGRCRDRVQALKASRPTTSAHEEQVESRSALAEALGAYADAAEASGVPLSHRYRNEMRLYRAIADNPRGRTGSAPGLRRP